MRIVSTASEQISTEARLGRLARELATATEEVASGTRADIARALGPRTAELSRIRGETRQLGTIRDTNGLLAARLSTMQRALAGVSDLAQDALADVAATSTYAPPGQIAATARAKLVDLGTRLDVTQDGMHLFSGSEVGRAAFRVGGDVAAPPLAGIVDAFTTHFGFPPSAAAAAAVTAGEMRGFMAGPFANLFSDAGWSAWSGAGGDAVEARIAPGESVAIATDARDPAVRQLVSGLALAAVFGASGLGAEARSAALEESTRRIGAGQAGIDRMRADLGRIEQRVAEASKGMSQSIDYLRAAESGLVDVDPTETAMRLYDIARRLEASLAVTRRLADLSLLRVL